MSVLAHVVFKFSLPPEPVATRSLAYILNRESDLAQAFVGMLHVANLNFNPAANVQAELVHEDVRPDLTIRDEHDRVRVFVENKFWTGLTDTQPVSYLRVLPEGVPTALLFIVPERRVTTVWYDLKQRCIQANLNWENNGDQDHIIWSLVDGKLLLITSWTHVLNTLYNATVFLGHDSIRCDILQLQDLTNRIDELETFLPIHANEPTDQETARRLINYCDLIESITQILQQNELADNCKFSDSSYYHGRYLRVHQRFELWFGIHFHVWRKFGVTPLWWIFDNNNYDGVRGHLEMIINQNLFDDAYYDEQSEQLCIPIHLEIGVERDMVIQNAAEQMTAIADMLNENIPNQPL